MVLLYTMAPRWLQSWSAVCVRGRSTLSPQDCKPEDSELLLHTAAMPMHAS